MSGILGVFGLDGCPVDERVPSRMLATLRHRGPEASALWCAGPIALGHCLLRTTPESCDEQQPHAAADPALRIVFDGRLDNRAELLASFEELGLRPGAMFDAALVLCAYQCWRASCAERLLGDFAFAVWDGRAQSLFCARDVLGLKPLYYHRGRDVFAFASEPQALLSHPSVTRQPNEGMVGEHLSVVTGVEETLFLDIQRLPPAQCMTVTANACRPRTYWTIDAAKPIVYRQPTDYAEHFLELLSEASRARLRSHADVGVMLSGGLDSSSIVAAIAPSGAERGCRTFSIVAPGQPWDESQAIDRIVSAFGCVGTNVPGSTPRPEHYRQLSRRYADVPPYPNECHADGLKAEAGRQGVRVLLTGKYGDEWFSGNAASYADLFRTFRWGSLLKKRWQQSQVPDAVVPGPLVKTMTWPLLSRPVRRRIKKLLGHDGVPPWINRRFARRIALADRLYPIAAGPAFPTAAQAGIYEEATSGATTYSMEIEDRLAAAAGVELRHPFADRRLMEFALGIPESMRSGGGQPKRVVRDAMRGRIPEANRLQFAAADATPLFVAPLGGLMENGLLTDSVLERRAWLDAGPARRLYETMEAYRATGDSKYMRLLSPLWMIAGVELWMQSAVESWSVEEV